MNPKDVLISMIEDMNPDLLIKDEHFIKVEIIQDVVEIINGYFEDKVILPHLEWNEDEISDHLKADGNKGTYWILENGWYSIDLINPTPAGPQIEKIGECLREDDAKLIASRWDLMPD